MPSRKENVSLYKVARRIFEEATTAALGPTCNPVITFHLQRKFGKDPSETFIEDPKAFYGALEEVFGAGAQHIILIVATLLIKKHCMTCSAGDFLHLLMKGDEASKKILAEIFSCAANEKQNQCSAYV